MNDQQKCWAVVDGWRTVAVFRDFAEAVNLAAERNGLTTEEQVRFNEVDPKHKAWAVAAGKGWLRVEEHDSQVPSATPGR